jgi:hypothetical protein
LFDDDDDDDDEEEEEDCGRDEERSKDDEGEVEVESLVDAEADADENDEGRKVEERERVLEKEEEQEERLWKGGVESGWGAVVCGVVEVCCEVDCWDRSEEVKVDLVVVVVGEGRSERKWWRQHREDMVVDGLESVAAAFWSLVELD